MAMPSSSVGPEVICSGFPVGKCWRQMWNAPPELELKYIHFPFGDHAAKVQAPSGGPTCRPGEFASSGTRRHGIQGPSISTTSTHLPFGEG
jgi:hypothetical protein